MYLQSSENVVDTNPDFPSENPEEEKRKFACLFLITKQFKIYMNKNYDNLEQLANVKTPDELLNLLEVSPSSLIAMVENPQYETFHIPKKAGGYRCIDAPSEDLKRVQQKLASHLSYFFINFQTRSVMGFVPNYKGINNPAGIVENAKRHIGQPIVLNIDVADFFPSIKISSIKKMFMQKPFSFNDELAHLLALLTCYKGKLPQGAPTSPILSNFFLLRADLKIERIMKKRELNYTRYADDITLSGFLFPQDKLPDIVQEILTPFGLRLNEKKIRYQTFVGRQEVTGIKVNVKLNLDRRYIRRIRAILHCWDVKGIEHAATVFHKRKINNALEFTSTIRGMIAHVGNVRGQEDVIFLRFHEKFNSLSIFEEMKVVSMYD